MAIGATGVHAGVMRESLPLTAPVSLADSDGETGLAGLPGAAGPEGAAGGSGGPALVWYASYGSNMRLARLTYYLAGGCPPGSTHRHPGCRDPRPPRLAMPVMLPGAMYFASESAIWTGGVSFYDPTAAGETAGRAYLLTAGQFADVAAQEMHRTPEADLDLAAVLRTGRAQIGAGRYETLVLVGHSGGVPVLTFTAPWQMADVEPSVPSGGYLTMLAAGIREAHGWPAAQIAAYLAARPGAAGYWAPSEIERLLTPTESLPVQTAPLLDRADAALDQAGTALGQSGAGLGQSGVALGQSGVALVPSGSHPGQA